MTNRELADFVSAQLAPLPEVRRIPMMGGFIFYYRERIFGGVYGTGFMVKNVPAAWRFMPGTSAEPPYDGAKPMLHVPILADSAKLPRHGAGDVGRTAGTSAEKAETLTAFWEAQRQISKKGASKGEKNSENPWLNSDK